MNDNERISWELFIFSEQYCDWRARASEAEGQEQLRNPNHNGAAPITVIHSPTTIIALDHSGCVKIGNIWFHLNQRNEYIYSCEQFSNLQIFDILNERMFECIWIFEQFSPTKLYQYFQTNIFKKVPQFFTFALSFEALVWNWCFGSFLSLTLLAY